MYVCDCVYAFMYVYVCVHIRMRARIICTCMCACACTGMCAYACTVMCASAYMLTERGGVRVQVRTRHVCTRACLREYISSIVGKYARFRR